MSRTSTIAFIVLGTAVACASPRQGEVNPAGPDAATFAPVANALVVRCGSLDCHGTPYRNLRLYGFGGLRLDPTQGPDMPDAATPAEVAADYDAVVSLEPDLTREVTAAKGAGAERLTFLRKARGAEEHKGKGPIVPGDDADRCVLSWFGGSVDVEACRRVVETR